MPGGEPARSTSRNEATPQLAEMSSSPAGPWRITRATLVKFDLGQASFQPQDLAGLHVAARLLLLSRPPAILGIDQPGDAA